MRQKLMYIFCGMVLAALIFQSFTMFYFVNSYSTNQKNKYSPYSQASYFADVAYFAVGEIEDIATSPPVGEYEESPGELSVPDYPPGETPEPEPENDEVPEEEPIHSIDPLDPDTEKEIEEERERIINERVRTLEIPDGYEGFYTDYTEKDLLYSILETMKVNQYIIMFVLAVVLVYVVFKPIVQGYGN